MKPWWTLHRYAKRPRAGCEQQGESITMNDDQIFTLDPQRQPPSPRDLETAQALLEAILAEAEHVPRYDLEDDAPQEQSG